MSCFVSQDLEAQMLMEFFHIITENICVVQLLGHLMSCIDWNAEFFISKHETDIYFSGLLCQKQVSRARTSNYIPQFLWDVITCPWPWYLLLAQYPSFLIFPMHQNGRCSWLGSSRKIKMPSYQYRKSQDGDNIIYSHNSISYTEKMTFLFWNIPQYMWPSFVSASYCLSICLFLRLESHIYGLASALVLEA